MLKLKLQYFGYLMWRADSLEKTLMQEDKGATENEMIGWHHWLNDMSLSKLQETVKDREAWHTAVRGVKQGLATGQQQYS